jgi:hypothetical protein
MLARPGYNGSGLEADPWWKHAVFYQVADRPPDSKRSPPVSTRFGARRRRAASSGSRASTRPARTRSDAEPRRPGRSAPPSQRHGIRVLLTIQAPAPTQRISPASPASGSPAASPACTSQRPPEPARTTRRPSSRPCASWSPARPDNASSSLTLTSRLPERPIRPQAVAPRREPADPSDRAVADRCAPGSARKPSTQPAFARC